MTNSLSRLFKIHGNKMQLIKPFISIYIYLVWFENLIRLPIFPLIQVHCLLSDVQIRVTVSFIFFKQFTLRTLLFLSSNVRKIPVVVLLFFSHIYYFVKQYHYSQNYKLNASNFIKLIYVSELSTYFVNKNYHLYY